MLCAVCRRVCPHCRKEALRAYKWDAGKTVWIITQDKIYHQALLVREGGGRYHQDLSGKSVVLAGLPATAAFHHSMGTTNCCC